VIDPAASIAAVGNDHVVRIRILLVAMPRLMRDIVEAALRAEPDMTLVGMPDETAGLVDEIGATEPDFVLIGSDHGYSVPSLLCERPSMRVLEIEPRAADVHLYELLPRRVDLGPVSANDLVAAIRTAARASRWERDVR
jgi:DNA-binding NarL/FixJ family response regulator